MSSNIIEKALHEINSRFGESIQNLILDGKLQRAGKKDHVWYVGHSWVYQAKEYQSVTYGSWKHAGEFLVKSWDADTESNKNFKKSFQNHTKEAKATLDLTKQEKQKKCREKWTPIFNSAKKGELHEYLKFKGIDQLYTAKNPGGNILLIPAYNSVSGLVGLQRIYRDEDKDSETYGQFVKKFTSGIEVRGAFCPLKPFREAEYCYISEGFATAASIQLAFPEIPSICVFNAGNIAPAIEHIRNVNPKIKIMISADSDQPDKIKGEKAGEKNAFMAAKKYPSVCVRVVKFSTKNPSWSDFNDLHQFESLEEVQNQLIIDPYEFVTVTPMGFLDTNYYYTSSSNSQIIKIPAAGHSNKVNFLQLAPLEYWKKNFGILDEDGQILKTDWEQVSSQLLKQCHDVGFFDPEQIRGRGVWFDDGIGVANDGDKVFPKKDASKFHYLRTLNIKYYQENDPMPDDEIMPLLSALANIRYKNQSDHIYVASWFIQAQIFGCIDWRFHVWLSGPKGTGKSKVLEHINSLLPHGIYSADATAAGIRQKAKNDSVPVCYDETEPGKKMVDVLELARAMNPRNDSGSLRGTSTGDVITYNCKMVFLFASIQVELLCPADASRIFVVEMSPDENEDRANWKSEVEPILIGFQPHKARIFARCFKAIPSIRKSVNITQGHLNKTRPFLEARVVDQLSTMIACYWVWASTEPITEDQAEAIIVHHKLIESEYVQDNCDSSDPEECLHEILTLQVDNQARSVAFCMRMVKEHTIRSRENSDAVVDEFTRYLSVLGIRYYPLDNKLFIAKDAVSLRSKLKKYPDYTKILMREKNLFIRKTKTNIKDYGNVRGIDIKAPDVMGWTL